MVRLCVYYFGILTMITGSCMGAQKHNAKIDVDTIRKKTWRLLGLFSENKSLCEKQGFRAIPTDQNINWFLWLAVEEGNLTLIQKVLELIPDIIQKYKLLYDAIRACNKRGNKKLNSFLSHGVNSNGYALHDVGRLTPYALAKKKYQLRMKHGPKGQASVYHKICQLFKQHGIEEFSPLDVARKVGNSAAQKLLLDNGAYPYSCFEEV